MAATTILTSYERAGADPATRSSLDELGISILFRHPDGSALLCPEGAQLNPSAPEATLVVDCSSQDAAALFEGRLTLAGALYREQIIVRGPVKHALSLIGVIPHIARNHAVAAA